MKLYEIAEQIQELIAMAEEENLDRKTIEDTMEGLEYEFEDKADAYAKVVKQLEADAAALETEINRMDGRKKVIKNNIDAMKRALENAMLLTGKKKFKAQLFSFGIQKNTPSLSLIDGKDIPQEFLIPQEPKIDRRAALEYVKSHDVDWAEIKQTESLRIR